MDRYFIFLTRVAIISISLYLLITLLFAWNGYGMNEYRYVLGHSLITDLVLTAASFKDKYYHCKWMRILCYNLIFTDVIGYIDTKWCIFENAETMLWALLFTWSISATASLYSAIAHFIKPRIESYKKFIWNKVD